MSISHELTELQYAWLDTSQLPRANRRALIEPLLLSLNHIKACRLTREECISALCGKLLKYWERFEPPVATCREEEAPGRIQVYVERIYRHFDEEWAGSLTSLTHQRAGLEDGYHFLILERRGSRLGRPKELEGDYETISLAIRKDLLARIDASNKSRRAYIEDLLILEQQALLLPPQQYATFASQCIEEVSKQEKTVRQEYARLVREFFIEIAPQHIFQSLAHLAGEAHRHPDAAVSLLFKHFTHFLQLEAYSSLTGKNTRLFEHDNGVFDWLLHETKYTTIRQTEMELKALLKDLFTICAGLPALSSSYLDGSETNRLPQ